MRLLLAFLVAATMTACNVAPEVITVDCTAGRLGNQILSTMETVKAPLSQVQRQFLAQDLVRIANANFETCDAKMSWITLLAIESRFDQSARSPVGAIGLGQIMPAHAKAFGKYCGIADLRPEDLSDRAINATVSACLFRRLLDMVPHNSTQLALAAYNSGPSSPSSKNLPNLGALQHETAQYIARFAYVKELVSIKASSEDKP